MRNGPHNPSPVCNAQFHNEAFRVVGGSSLIPSNPRPLRVCGRSCAGKSIPQPSWFHRRGAHLGRLQCAPVAKDRLQRREAWSLPHQSLDTQSRLLRASMQRLDAEQKKAKRVMLRIQKRTSKAAFKIQELKHELSHHEKENLKRAADLRDKQWLLENAIPHQKRLRNIEVYPASPLPFEHVDPALVESHVNQMQKQAQDSVAQAAMALALHNDETSASEQRVKAEQDTLKKELDDMEAYKARLEAAKKHIEDEYLAGLTEQLEAQNEEHEEVLNSKEAADIIATSKGFSGLFNVRVSEDLELPDCYTFIEKLDEIDLDEIEGDKARRKAEEKKKKRLKRITDNLGKECNIDKGDCGSSALECVETPVTRLEWEFDQEKRLASFRKAVKQLRHKGKCCLPSLPSTQL